MLRRRVRRPRPGPAAVALVVTLAAMTGCIGDPVTDRGREVATLYAWFMVAAAGVFVLVVGLITWSIVRYRGQPGRNVPMPPPVAGNLTLEVVWWALPAALVAALAIFTVVVLSQVDARSDDPELTVEVTGYQWGWEFVYAEADVIVNGTADDPARVPLPVGRTIAFEIRSADVVHSFNVPAFLIKRDAVPTRVNRFDVVIEEEGTYAGQCGEFCGLLHAEQLFELDAVDAATFDAWLADAHPPASAEPAAEGGAP